MIEPGMLTLGASVGATGLVRDLAITLLAAAGVALVLKQVRLSAIPGYLIAGALIGPTAIGLISDGASVDRISELALVLLMFSIGLHMDPEILLGQMRRPLFAGLVSTALTTAVVFPIGLLFGLGAPAAMAVAMAVAMSSTAVVVSLLQQRRELKQSHGRLVFGILMMQDVLVVVMLGAIPTLAAWGGIDGVGGLDPERKVLQVLARTLVTVGGIGLLVVVGRALLPRLMALAAHRADGELAVVMAGAMALGTGLATASMGYSAELGGFLAGFLLAGTPFRHHVEGRLAPMRDLFMAVFFVAVGMELDFGVLGPSWWVTLLVLVGMLVVKFGSIAFGSWLAGASPAIAVRSGAILSESGEFTLVVLAAAVSAGVVADGPADVIMGAVVVSLIATPGLVMLGERLAPLARGLPSCHFRFMKERGPRGLVEETEEQDDSRPVILAGFGPVGRAIAQRLDLAGEPYVIVDLNPVTIERQLKLGKRAVWGDITNERVLEGAGIGRAVAVVITIPDDQAVLRGIRAVRSMAPGILIAVRATVLSMAFQAREAGADVVTVEEVATAEAMTGEVMRALGERGEIELRDRRVRSDKAE